jgi:F0F1-type ATP synthase membrane subunit b/b'
MDQRGDHIPQLKKGIKEAERMKAQLQEAVARLNELLKRSQAGRVQKSKRP